MSDRQGWRIAAMPGDGIGTEVMDATLRVLAELDVPLEWERLDWPSTAWHRNHGAMMPDDALEYVRDYDALLLGALGDPGPADDATRYVLPDGISLSPLLTLRKGLDLWACERPARLFPGGVQYLADPRARDVDMLVIRENSEGEYVNQGGRLHRGTDREVATQTEVFTRQGSERIIRHAFERARQRAAERTDKRSFRKADGNEAASQVCLITKRNALPHWGELYTEIFNDIATEYPDVATHHELIDAACMKFVQAPWQFDVVVASNLQGDILTDLAAVLSGGMGVAPSMNINPADRANPALFEPTHGSAPDIAGKQIADPRAMMLTAAMMLDWMGEEDDTMAAGAARLKAAVQRDMVASEGGKPRRTDDVAGAIIEQLKADNGRQESRS